VAFTITRCPHPLVEEVYASRQLPLETGGSAPMNVYIPREEGDYLYSLVGQARPLVTVEVGMANGLSTLFIAAAHRDNGDGGRHIAIDPFQARDWHNVGIGLLRQAGVADLVRLVELPSHQGLPALEREGVRAGLIFIDGAHLTDYVMADFLVGDRILDVGGLIAFDDADWPAVKAAIRYVLANRSYEVAHPEVVIEPAPGRPSIPARILRAAGRRSRWLGDRLNPSFLQPDANLGIAGRCVVLRKKADDARDSQSRDGHRAF
jgi:predicted O-methyltransferase YrrM